LLSSRELNETIYIPYNAKIIKSVKETMALSKSAQVLHCK